LNFKINGRYSRNSLEEVKKGFPTETDDTRGVHMPDLDIPADEKIPLFISKKNGGIHLYCVDFSRCLGQALGDIIERK